MANLNDLARRLTRQVNELDDRANVLKIAVGTAVVVDLVQNTPVDESTALSNWVVSIGDKNGNKLPAFVPGSQGSTRGASIGATIAAAFAILRTVRPGQTVWISNNLPYIRRLNDGYSRQAPAGFVERAMLIGRKTLERVKF